MKFDFNGKFSEFLKIIINSARKQNKRVFFAGGAVRDNLLNIPIRDFDLLFEGDAVAFCKTLPDTIKIKSIHKDFATLKLLYKGLEVDIASTRLESYPYSGCLPVIEKIGTDILSDFKRRDFSINALYCKLDLDGDEIKCELIDYSGGVLDIKNKVLRVLHDKSYVDDPTRIIRGLGFKYRLGFDFSPHDKELIKSYFKNIDRKNMSIDRIKSVFKLVLSNIQNREIFLEAIEKKYYKILSSKEIYFDFEKFQKTSEIFKSLINFCEFYCLILENNELQKIVCENQAQYYKLFSKFKLENLAYYFYKTNDEEVLKYLKNKDIKLIISGSDLIKLGFCEGRTIGRILDMLLNEKLKNPQGFLSYEDEINYVLARCPKNLKK